MACKSDRSPQNTRETDVQQDPTRKRGYDDEATKSESQQMLALGPLLKRPKGDDKEIRQFGDKIRVDQREIKELLQQRLQKSQMEDTRRRNELASLISGALQTQLQPTVRDVATFPNTSIMSNNSFNSALKMSEACQNLLSEYSAFERMVTDMANHGNSAVDDPSAHDIEETERLLRLGHKIALKNVNKVLGLGVGDAVGNESEERGEDGGEEVPKTHLNYDLVKSLRYAERGVKRMVKALPKDEARF